MSEGAPKPYLEPTPQEIEIATIMKAAIRHTQGSAASTGYILEYLAVRNYFNHLILPPTLPPYIQETVRPPHQHKKVSKDMIIDTIDDVWESFQFYCRPGFPPIFRGESSDADRIKFLSHLITFFDSSYIAKGRIRHPIPDRVIMRGEDLTDSAYDAHASFFRKYGVLGHATEHPGIDAMYKDIAEYAAHHPDFPGLSELTRLWEDHHPDQSFFPKNWYETRGTHKKQKTAIVEEVTAEPLLDKKFLNSIPQALLHFAKTLVRGSK